MPLLCNTSTGKLNIPVTHWPFLFRQVHAFTCFMITWGTAGKTYYSTVSTTFGISKGTLEMLISKSSSPPVYRSSAPLHGYPTYHASEFERTANVFIPLLPPWSSPSFFPIPHLSSTVGMNIILAVCLQLRKQAG